MSCRALAAPCLTWPSRLVPFVRPVTPGRDAACLIMLIAHAQDLSGFHDPDMSLKAVHGLQRRAAAAQLGNSTSMPLPRGDPAEEECASAQPPHHQQQHAGGNAVHGVPVRGRGMGRPSQGRGFKRSLSGREAGGKPPEEAGLAERIQGKSAGPACSMQVWRA